MAIQAREDNTYRSLIVKGEAKVDDSATMVKNTSATKDIVDNTVVYKDPATGLWSPYISVVATNGSEFPRGIYKGDTITIAAIKAANVTGLNIIVGGQVEVDSSMLIFEVGTITLASEITNQNLTVKDALVELGIFPKAVNFISALENS